MMTLHTRLILRVARHIRRQFGNVFRQGGIDLKWLNGDGNFPLKDCAYRRSEGFFLSTCSCGKHRLSKICSTRFHNSTCKDVDTDSCFNRIDIQLVWVMLIESKMLQVGGSDCQHHSDCCKQRLALSIFFNE